MKKILVLFAVVLTGVNAADRAIDQRIYAQLQEDMNENEALTQDTWAELLKAATPEEP